MVGSGVMPRVLDFGQDLIIRIRYSFNKVDRVIARQYYQDIKHKTTMNEHRYREFKDNLSQLPTPSSSTGWSHGLLSFDTTTSLPIYLDIVILPVYYRISRITIRYALKKARRLNVPMSHAIIAVAAKYAFICTLYAVMDTNCISYYWHSNHSMPFIGHLEDTFVAATGLKAREIMLYMKRSTLGSGLTTKTKHLFEAPTAEQMEEHWRRFTLGQTLIPPDMHINW